MNLSSDSSGTQSSSTAGHEHCPHWALAATSLIFKMTSELQLAVARSDLRSRKKWKSSSSFDWTVGPQYVWHRTGHALETSVAEPSTGADMCKWWVLRLRLHVVWHHLFLARSNAAGYNEQVSDSSDGNDCNDNDKQPRGRRFDHLVDVLLINWLASWEYTSLSSFSATFFQSLS